MDMTHQLPLAPKVEGSRATPVASAIGTIVRYSCQTSLRGQARALRHPEPSRPTAADQDPARDPDRPSSSGSLSIGTGDRTSPLLGSGCSASNRGQEGRLAVRGNFRVSALDEDETPPKVVVLVPAQMAFTLHSPDDDTGRDLQLRGEVQDLCPTLQIA